MSAAEDFSGLVGDIYDTATDQSRWPGVIERLMRALSASSGALASFADPGYEGAFHCAANLDPAMMSTYEHYYHQHDILRQSAMSKGYFESGKVSLGHRLVDPAHWHRSTLFNEWAVDAGIDSVIAMTLWGVEASNGVPPTFLAFYRPMGKDLFDTENARFAANLMPHLQRATLISRKLAHAELKTRSSEAVLDHFEYGVIQLSAFGQVIHANRAARTMMGRGAALRLDGGSLNASDSRNASKVRALISKAASGIGGLLEVPAATEGLSTLVVAVSLSPESNLRWRPDARVLVLLSVGGGNANRVALVGHAKGLTPAEVRVLRLLVDDRSPAEIAAALDTKIATVRSQLKSIYFKLDVHSQRELLALVNRVPPLAGGHHSDSTSR